MANSEAEPPDPSEPDAGDEDDEYAAGPAATSALRDELRTLLPSVLFIAAWVLLNAVSNTRYPEPEPKLWYLVPSLDVTLILSVYAGFGWFGRRVPLALHAAFVVFIVIARLVRSLDAIGMRELSRTFNFYIDVPLLPELWRLGYWTLPLWQFALAVLSVPLAVALVAGVAHVTFRAAERYFSRRSHVRFFALLGAVFVVLSLVRPKRAPRYDGVFGASAAPRLFQELAFALNASGYRASTLTAMAEVERKTAEGPHDLAALGGANVFLFFVESYGQTLLDRADFRAAIARSYREVEGSLAQHGFSVASGVLASPAYGGGSWLAHATLATGVRTGDQFQYDLVMAKKPKTLDRFFREAGYRTVVVEPATTRPIPGRSLTDFDERYYAAQLGYKGPRFDWATMPDQFVLDFLRKKRFVDSPRPLFLECVLISSHAPWQTQPPVIEHWDRIGDGSIFGKLAAVRFRVNWSNMEEAGPAYLRSITYELEVLRRFIIDVISDDSLVLILGDHQPIAEVTKYSAERGVPMHVISRNRALLEPFVARGYARGMMPVLSARVRPFETFLPDFLKDFSSRR